MPCCFRGGVTNSAAPSIADHNRSGAKSMDTLDRDIVDALQDGIPVCDRPFAALAESLSISERALLQ